MSTQSSQVVLNTHDSISSHVVQDLVSRCTCLLALSLAATCSEDSTIACLATACPSLQVLDLSCCHHITSASSSKLTAISTLTALRTPPQLSSESLEAVVATLPNLQVVQAGVIRFHEKIAHAHVHSSATEAEKLAAVMDTFNKAEGDTHRELQSHTASRTESEDLHAPPHLLPSRCRPVEQASQSIVDANSDVAVAQGASARPDTPTKGSEPAVSKHASKEAMHPLKPATAQDTVPQVPSHPPFIFSSSPSGLSSTCACACYPDKHDN